MAIQLSKRLITVKEYHLMSEVGILSSLDRVELINGEIINMSPIGSRHATTVKRIHALFYKLFSDKAIISVQDPIHISEKSEPKPDIALLKKPLSQYEYRHPKADDTFLVVEVADTSLEYDTDIKLPLYAQAGIQECWIVNLEDGIIEQYKEPSDNIYTLRKILQKGELLQLDLFEVEININELLG